MHELLIIGCTRLIDWNARFICCGPLVRHHARNLLIMVIMFTLAPFHARQMIYLQNFHNISIRWLSYPSVAVVLVGKKGEKRQNGRRGGREKKIEINISECRVIAIFNKIPFLHKIKTRGEESIKVERKKNKKKREKRNETYK
jgi:hypothetical protein